MKAHDLLAPCDGCVAPTGKNIEALAEFVSRRTESESLLIHCHAGIHRSPAAAMIVAVLRRPGQEVEFARRLRHAGDWMRPNRRVADEVLRT